LKGNIKMKKFLSIFLASVLIVLMFVSCNKDTSDQSQNSLPANDSGSDLPSDSTTEETDKVVASTSASTDGFNNAFAAALDAAGVDELVAKDAPKKRARKKKTETAE
jgi:hypothetical protein